MALLQKPTHPWERRRVGRRERHRRGLRERERAGYGGV